MRISTFFRPSIFRSILFYLLVVGLFSACTPPAGTKLTFPRGTEIYAEVADTPETRKTGLMFRDQLPEGGALLFVFPEASPYQFWMKNCKFPIDIIWLDPDQKIVYIAKDTPPCSGDPCPTYGPKTEKALYVLELAAGFSKKEQLRLGSVIQFDAKQTTE